MPKSCGSQHRRMSARSARGAVPLGSTAWTTDTGEGRPGSRHVSRPRLLLELLDGLGCRGAHRGLGRPARRQRATAPARTTWSDSMPRPRPEAIPSGRVRRRRRGGPGFSRAARCTRAAPCTCSCICSSAERCQAAISVRRSSTSSRVIIRRPVHHVVPTTVRMTAVAAIQVCRFCRSMPCARLFSLLRETAPSPTASGGSGRRPALGLRGRRGRPGPGGRQARRGCRRADAPSAPARGHFRTRAIVRATLNRISRHVARAIADGDRFRFQAPHQSAAQ